MKFGLNQGFVYYLNPCLNITYILIVRVTISTIKIKMLHFILIDVTLYRCCDNLQ
jgi:hypothetical protein